MQGLIEKRGNQIYYRFNHRGKEYRRPTGLVVETSSGKTSPALLRQAREIEKRAKAELIHSGVSAPRAKRFQEAAEEFLEWARTTEYRAKQSTFRRIQTSFATLAEFFGDFRVSEITPGHIEQYKTWRFGTHGVRDITVRHDLYNLSLFFKRYAMKMHWANANPTLEVRKPSDAEALREHILTAEEEQAYFAIAKGNLYDVARLILLQGCRPEEILALEKDDVDLAGKQLRIRGGKTRAARRTLDLVGESVAILEHRVAAADKWLFPSPRKRGQHLAKLNFPHDQACVTAKVAFTLYDLRHTFATRILQAGVDVATVAAILGHGSLRTVHRYLHPQAAAKKDAMRKYEESLRPVLTMVKKSGA